MLGYVYLCLLLFIILIVSMVMIKNLRFSPTKIKYYFLIGLILLLLKNIILFIVYVVQKQSIAYGLRNLVLLNFIAIPIIAIGVLYVFMRNENLKFDFNYIYLFILSVSYILFAFVYSKSIKISNTLGFIILVDNPIVPYLIYLIVLATICVTALWFIDKPNCNKFGMRSLLLTMIISIVEFIFIIGSKSIFPYSIISEMFILITCYIAVSTFKKLKDNK